jgi:hypothetical protein
MGQVCGNLVSPRGKNTAHLLRDHAREMRLEITEDMETAQSLQHQAASLGTWLPFTNEFELQLAQEAA